MNIKSQLICRYSIIIVLLGVLQSTVLLAQPIGTQEFIEAKPPAGLVKGIIKAGNQRTVLLVGGKTVVSNSTFTVTTRGHRVTWKVIGFTEKEALFARLVSDTPSPYSTSPDCVPNFGSLLMLLEENASMYKLASTSILKDQVMTETRNRVKEWCNTNQLCIAATLSDIKMIDDATACLQLNNVNRGEFNNIRYPLIFMEGPSRISIPITNIHAASLKAGYKVIITGNLSFSQKDEMLMHDGPVRRKGHISFWINLQGDPRFVGAILLNQVKYDIFDSKAETVQL